MKALIKPKLSKKAEAVIRHQVSVECNKVTKKYEILEDVCWLYCIAQQTGFRKKRLERLYKGYWKLREEVQEFVRNGEDNSIEDGLRELYMAQALRSYGIDIEEMYNTLGGERIEHVTTN